MFGLKSHFSTKNLQMDIGQLFWLYMDIVVKQCVKVPFGYIYSICVLLNEFPSCECWVKKQEFLMKKRDQHQSEQNQSEQNQSEWNQSEWNQSEWNQNFLKSPWAPWSYFFADKESSLWPRDTTLSVQNKVLQFILWQFSNGCFFGTGVIHILHIFFCVLVQQKKK